MLTSVNSSIQGFTQKFGYFEADIQIPQGAGSWPAWWLYSADHFTNGAPPSELDIMENAGSDTTKFGATIHDGLGTQNGNAVVNAGVDLSQGFHRYGMLWDPNASTITWYLDGKAISSAEKYSTTDVQTMMMTLNEEVGDFGGGGPNSSTPANMHMLVDYVRAYQFAGQGAVAIAPEAVSTAPGNTDPVAQVNALGQSGSSPAPSASPTPNTSTPPAPVNTGSGANTVTVHVSGDHWAGHAGGDPQFVVLVDGQQIGGVQTVSAVHDNGQWQDITLNGNFANPQEVDVKFLNDTYGGSHATDVNLYVGSITVNGHTYAGTSGTDNAAGTFGSMDPNAAVMVWNGTTSFNTAGAGSTTPAATPTPAPAPAPTPAPDRVGPRSVGHGHGDGTCLGRPLGGPRRWRSAVCRSRRRAADRWRPDRLGRA